jgi:4-amino-4-deoxy-L-arabinose transferase-like glycosyltransferase
MTITKRHILIIVVLSILTKLAALAFLNPSINPGMLEYEILAANMMETGTYSMNFREYGDFKGVIAPGYSFLIYGIYKIFGIHREILVFLQIGTMTIFSLIIYAITLKCTANRVYALFAGILISLHPGILYYNIMYVHNFNIYLPLFYGTILLFIGGLQEKSDKLLLWAGFTAGLATLTRGTFSPIFIVCLLFYLLLKREVPLRRKLSFAALSFLIFVGVNTPWTIRNYIQFGKPVYSQNTKWESFWVGNNPNASGGHFHGDGTLVLSTKPPEMQAEIDANKGNEIAIEEVFKKYAMDYVKKNPFHFIKGLVRKAFYFWWFYPQTGLFYPRAFLIAYKTIYCILLAFAAGGIYICHKERLWRKEMIFPLMLVLGIWAAHTMNFMEIRHRWTVEPMLLIFAAIGIWRLIPSLFHLLLRKICKSNYVAKAKL